MLTYSVVIPAFNAAPFIQRAVLSCLNQTFKPTAIIVVDDASTDQTKEVLASWIEDGSIIYKRQDQNKGVSAARNLGRSIAETDWVAFLDSDDEWHPQKMEVCSVYIQQHAPKVLTHLFQYEDWSFAPLEEIEKVKMISFAHLLFRNRTATCTLLLHRSVDEMYDEHMRFCEDYDLLLRIAYHQAIPELQQKLARVHRVINTKGGLSGELWQMRKGEIKMYRKLSRLHIKYLFLFPFLLVYSLLKHIRLLLKQ